MEVDKDELAKLMSSVGTELAKEIQEIKRNWGPQVGQQEQGEQPE